jgi:hypothetical protein
MTRRLFLPLVTAAALLVTTAPAVQAHHRPNLYCSETGDLCQATRKVDGVRKLRIILAAEYFDICHLCVRSPDGVTWCAPYRGRERSDGTFGRSVNWFKDWGGRMEGSYTVRWVVDGDRIGRRLGFHVR